MYSKIGLKFKRRVEQKTDYTKRLAMLKSGKPRFGIRRTNLYINLQYLKHTDKGDISELNLLSKALKEYGWTKGFKSQPACYLAGYLFGKLVIAKKLGKEMIVDLGLQKAHKGGKVFAAIKGAVDAGLDIPVSEESFPKADRVNGKHLGAEAIFNKVKESIDKNLKLPEKKSARPKVAKTVEHKVEHKAAESAKKEVKAKVHKDI